MEFDDETLTLADRVAKTLRRELGPSGKLVVHAKGMAPWCAYVGGDLVADAWDLPELAERLAEMRARKKALANRAPEG